MLILHPVIMMFSLGVVVLGSGFVSGQEFPNKTVRVITAAPGGSTDRAARLIAQGLSTSLGQSFIVEPRGGTPATAADYVSKSPADGYVVLFTTSGHWIGPLLENVPYDSVRDFTPVSLTNKSPNVLVVHPSLPVKSVKDLIVLAKAKPGALNYATSGPGGSTHLAAELFKSMAGVNIVRISYKSGTSETNDLLSGEVQTAFGTLATATPLVKSGRLRALGVTGTQPSPMLPGIPTVAATLPGYEAGAVNGMLAPAKTPAAIVNRLHQEIARVLNRPETKDQFVALGIETVGNSSEEFAVFIKTDIARWTKVIKEAGITAN